MTNTTAYKATYESIRQLHQIHHENGREIFERLAKLVGREKLKFTRAIIALRLDSFL